MEIPLLPKFEKMLHEKVASGAYTSISEVVQRALLLLDEKEKSQQIDTASENTRQYLAKEVVDHLAVTIWNGEKWKPHVLDTLDISRGNNYLAITNTSHQHDHVKLILNEKLPQSFKIEVVLEGQWRELGLLDASGADRVIYFGASNTDKYTYTLEREGDDLILRRDNKKISHKILSDIHTTDHHFFIGVNANNSIKMYTEVQQVPNNCEKPQQPIHYKFTIDVISGSHNGDTYSGTFSYDASLLKNSGCEKIEVIDLEFVYRGETFSHFNCDSIPEVEFIDGEFKDLYLVGGPQTKRFGINAGFERYQFGRSSEFFIRENKSYFGYLDKATYVDGAGKIEYCKVDSN